VPTESVRSNERDAELLFVGRMIKEQDAPTIVAGDLNDVAWSRTTKLFQKISGLLDPRIGRGLYSSFHAKYPLIKFPLDHVFHTNHFRLVELKRLPNIGSDHYPIFITLAYEITAEITQPKPVATAEEKREAVETIVETLELIKEEN
jgi:endonuclease/exonuclease/phosphatase (EEP) superfamily protein YafD